MSCRKLHTRFRLGPRLTSNSVMIADARYLCGSWASCILYLASPFIHNDLINVELHCPIGVCREGRRNCSTLSAWLWWQVPNGDAVNLVSALNSLSELCSACISQWLSDELGTTIECFWPPAKFRGRRGLSVCFAHKFRFIFAHPVQQMQIKFVYGHRVKIKVTEAKMVQNPYSRNVKLRSAITSFYKIQSHEVACSMGFSVMADRMVWPPSLSRDTEVTTRN